VKLNPVLQELHFVQRQRLLHFLMLELDPVD
jgi:hypothetical protein